MNTTHRYFDLFEYIPTITEAYVAAQVAQSTAWRIDTLITGKARSLLRTLREEAVLRGDADKYSETAAMLRDLAVGEQWFKATGLDSNTIEDIIRLNALRQRVHESAAELTALQLDWTGRPRKYEIPTIEEAFYAEPNTKVSASVKARIEISSRALAEAYGIDPQVLRERRLAAQQRQAVDRAESVMETADLAYWVYQQALQAMPTELESLKRQEQPLTAALALEEGFVRLSMTTQITLVTNARQAAERAITFAESERNLTDSEFARILACALATTKHLTGVLNSERFQREASKV